MSKKQSLQSAIDRMVEASIRRILPTVMNEVLIKVVANSGVIQEQRPSTRIQRQTQVQVPGRKATPKTQKAMPSSLREMLDEQAGAEFYDDPRDAMRQHTRQEEPEPEFDEVDIGPGNAPALARRLEHLNPELRQLAEDMDLTHDEGEMWGEDEHDSVQVINPVNEIKDPVRAAKAVGLDFSRMAQTIKVAIPNKKVNAEDVRAKAQFEEQRLKRKREQLNGGKPIE